MQVGSSACSVSLQCMCLLVSFVASVEAIHRSIDGSPSSPARAVKNRTHSVADLGIDGRGGATGGVGPPPHRGSGAAPPAGVQGTEPPLGVWGAKPPRS